MSTSPSPPAAATATTSATAIIVCCSAGRHHPYRKSSSSNRPGACAQACVCFHRFASPAYRSTRLSLRVALAVANDSNSPKLGASTSERSEEADKIVDDMDFGELCNEFECISSPSVEATARQLARDILELREGNRSLGIYAVSVRYKDPVRSFTGRDKYKRPLWVTDALEKPTASVQEMAMLSTSVLRINWTIRGKPKTPLAGIMGGDLIIKVTSKFTLNQISGQVIEHEESWDLSASSALAQAYFWTSRRLYSAVEAGRDLGDSLNTIRSQFLTKKENIEIYRDPSVDPTKFFQNDDGFQRDAYQLALFLAVVYLVVQFLRITL